MLLIENSLNLDCYDQIKNDFTFVTKFLFNLSKNYDFLYGVAIYTP